MAVTWPLRGRYVAVTWPLLESLAQVLALRRCLAVTRPLLDRSRTLFEPPREVAISSPYLIVPCDAQVVEPHRLHGIEVQSTILWHLKREVALCYLAKRVLDFEPCSPYACCVVGNCFSLQKEHDTALKFFQRAIQLQPDFAYAYTLSGHEYSANDDFEKAMACYRSAVRIDERHYNAWYGLGNIYYRQVRHPNPSTSPNSNLGNMYYRQLPHPNPSPSPSPDPNLGNIYFWQEKYDFAEHHLRKALEINPSSSPLFCYLGMALHANQKTRQARETLPPTPLTSADYRGLPRNTAHSRGLPLFTLICDCDCAGAGDAFLGDRDRQQEPAGALPEGPGA